MASENDTNLTAVNDPGEGEKTIGFRADPEQLKRINLAWVYGGFPNRAAFIEAAVVEKAERVLAAQAMTERPDRRGR